DRGRGGAALGDDEVGVLDRHARRDPAHGGGDPGGEPGFGGRGGALGDPRPIRPGHLDDLVAARSWVVGDRDRFGHPRRGEGVADAVVEGAWNRHSHWTGGIPRGYTRGERAA